MKLALAVLIILFTYAFFAFEAETQPPLSFTNTACPPGTRDGNITKCRE